jgi:DNA modification methylase
VAAAFRPAARRFLVWAAFRPAARRLRVWAAFWAGESVFGMAVSYCEFATSSGGIKPDHNFADIGSVPLGNTLFYGDNLVRMEAMDSQSVDLIYLDPPFKSDQNYNLMYRNKTGRPVPEQQHAFADTWEMDAQKEELARAMPLLMKTQGISDEVVRFWETWTRALRDVQPPLLAYLIYMVPRLLQMKRILRDHGSIYLHCDPTASHYIKVMMDAIFGHQNFRNEIVWTRTQAHGRAKKWGPIHDTLLFYTKSDKYVWNRVLQKYDQSYLDSHYTHSDAHGVYRLVTLDGPGIRKGSSGLPWKGVDPTPKGRHWELPPDRALPDWFVHPPGYADMTVQERLDVLEAQGIIYWPPRGKFPNYKRYLTAASGNPIQDVITDIAPINSQAEDRLGYPTQKPVPLLKRIIEASSNAGSVVFDPFCGCGTTIYAAQELGRTWVGCDIAIIAIGIVKEELGTRYKLVEDVDFTVDGIPVSAEQAEALAAKDKTQFQNWAVEMVGGYPNAKKSGDLGIDGSIWFETHDGLRRMVLSVKGGAIKPADVRDLRGVLERERDCEMAGFISLREPTKAMRDEASKAGMFTYARETYPRLQLLSVEDMFDRHRKFETPARIGTKTSTGQGSLPLR